MQLVQLLFVVGVSLQREKPSQKHVGVEARVPSLQEGRGSQERRRGQGRVVGRRWLLGQGCTTKWCDKHCKPARVLKHGDLIN